MLYGSINSLVNPIFEKLDRVLMSTDWEHKFPLVTVHALERSLSDHTPLLLNTRAASYRGSQPLFKFELGWLCRDGFRELVANAWKKKIRGHSALHIWQCKIRSLRQYLRGWAKNVSGTNKKDKLELNLLIDKLDKKAELARLSDEDLSLKKYANERLANLLREEEIKWYQRAKAKFLLEGDRNTRF